MRVLHFSDVHVETSLRGVPLSQMLNKRVIGLANLMLLRSRRHRDAEAKLEALARLMEEEQVDVVVCTGDYTALGTEPEVAHARRVIEPFTRAPKGFVTVPGNHDIYLHDAVREHRFERHFGDLLHSDLPWLCTDGPWPIVRLVGDDLVFVAVDSARPNPQPWRSSGHISVSQIEGLEQVLRDPRVRERFVVLATHYAPRLADGRPDGRRHGLDNAEELLELCELAPRGMLLHGHVHHTYCVRRPELPMPLFGAGSATHSGREGLWLFELDGRGGTATQGRWAGDRYTLDSATTITLD